MGNVKKLLLILAILLCPWHILGQTTGALQGTSTLGGISATTQGSQSSNKLQGVIPAALISIYYTGTTTLATGLTSDGTHPLANPFYSNASNAVNPGGFIAFVLANQGYDIVASSGQGVPNCITGPLCYTQPVTLCKDCYASEQFITPPSIEVAAIAPIQVNGGPGPVGTGTATISCQNGNCSNLQMGYTPPQGGQYILLYPTTCSATGSAVCGPTSGSVSSSASGNVNWSNFGYGGTPGLPSFVTSVTAIYGVMTSIGYNSQPGPPEYYGTFNVCTSSPYGGPVVPQGGPFVDGWSVTQVNCTIPTSTTISSVVANIHTAASLPQTGGGIGTYFLALAVYYTGTPPASTPTIQVDPCLQYNDTTNSISLPLPFDMVQDTGSVNAYAGYACGTSPYITGTEVSFYPNATNTTTAPTFNLNGSGNSTITKGAGSALAAGDILLGSLATLRWNTASNGWQLINPQSAAAVAWPANKDIVVSNTTNSPGGVAPATNGNVVCVESLVWVADTPAGCGISGGSGNYQNIGSAVTWSMGTGSGSFSGGVFTVGTAGTSIKITAIPGTYLNLRVVVVGRNDDSGATSTDALGVGTNADTAADYVLQTLSAATSTVAAAAGVGISPTTAQVGLLTTPAIGANYFASSIFEFQGYSFTGMFKLWSGHAIALTDGGLDPKILDTLMENNDLTTAINEVDLYAGSHNFVAGTKVMIYASN